jgi:ComF family protein
MEIPWMPEAHCVQCAIPLKPNECISSTTENILCARCLMQPPAFTHTLAACTYDAPLERWISSFKFHHQLHHMPLLAELWLHRCGTQAQEHRPDCIFPVPLHNRRLRWRGFNQALLLGKFISKAIDCPLETDLCLRTQPTPTQRLLTAGKRRKNLTQAFSVQKSVNGLHIALMDDVITTGATGHAVAKALLEAGAKQVDLWGIARVCL